MYTKQRDKFLKAEKALQRALDRLQAARNGDLPSDITTARTAAAACERAAAEEWELLEEQRRQHWEARAAEAQKALEDLALPFLAEVIQCRRNSGRMGLMVAPVQILQHLGTLPLPPVTVAIDGVPAEPLASAALDQAEEDV
tara:strand:- start:35868 stop:36293 length:426 start_codon:yes stop_codon:yes gene_type:complete